MNFESVTPPDEGALELNQFLMSAAAPLLHEFGTIGAYFLKSKAEQWLNRPGAPKVNPETGEVIKP